MKLTREFLDKIQNCKWLENCGKKNSEVFDFEVMFIEDMEEVVKNIKSVKWENVCLEKKGDFTAYLSQNYKNEYNKYWNNQIRTVKREYFPMVIDELSFLIQENKLENCIIDDIKFNLLTLYMVNFYSDYYKDTFFDNMLNIYLAGHLPCGWIGEYPEGKFIVY